MTLVHLDMDEASVGDEWNSGETLAVTIVDQDLNKNTGSRRRYGNDQQLQ